MSSHLRRLAVGLILLLAPSLLALSVAADAPAPTPPRPRLAVLVVFDQMRGDYLTQWQKLFGEGGFRRLQKDGAWYVNCHFPQATTVTGASHSSLATGCTPNLHGIPQNDWYSRELNRPVYCATENTDRYQRVPPPPANPDKDPKPAGKKMNYSVTPENLRAQALGDVLKDATKGQGKVVSLSLKDRGAVFFTGRQPESACYWYDADTGEFVTSTYYRQKEDPWVAEFNASKAADRWAGKEWTRLRDDLNYELFSGPDDAPGEGEGVVLDSKGLDGRPLTQGRTFPHPMSGLAGKPEQSYYQALYSSPFGNELLLELAQHAITTEKLGQHDVPDLLCLSFSCNDPIGHTWGPDSQEVLDVTLRSDRILKELLDTLDREVGKGRYILGLAADHGVCPLPEVSRGQNREALRLDVKALAKEAEPFLDQQFGKNTGPARWVEDVESPWIYLNKALLTQRGLDEAEVQGALVTWLEKQPGVQKAYGRAQLLRGLPPEDVGRAVLRSFYPSRCGDIVLVPKRYTIFYAPLTGTTHGTPHSYDTHVPLLLLGPGIVPGLHEELVEPLALPVILARGLGIPAPVRAIAPLPANLFAPGSP
jgi:predicted AlkP superfamily pyrophosphatase or phosphodiesterase